MSCHSICCNQTAHYYWLILSGLSLGTMIIDPLSSVVVTDYYTIVEHFETEEQHFIYQRSSRIFQYLLKVSSP
jgi:hypothetical protein